MKRIAIISLAVIFLATQYSYTLASCELCGTGVSEVLNGITKPDTDALEGMFIELGLSDDIEQTDLGGSYSVTLGEVTITMVPLYDGGIYFFAEKEGTLFGAVKHDGMERMIIPNIVPEQSLLILICILIIAGFLGSIFLAWGGCYYLFVVSPGNLLDCLVGVVLTVASSLGVDFCFF